MSATVLVTGGAGFVGSHLVEALLNQGMPVRVLDNFSTGSLENLRECRGELELVRGDIRDLGTCYEACRGVETVFHQAALPSAPRSIAFSLTANAVNVDGTLQMLMAARDRGVRRFVFASSCDVYGDGGGVRRQALDASSGGDAWRLTPDAFSGPMPESLPPSPLSPYAIGKLTGEYYCRIFSQLYGLETVALRYFNGFGPRQSARCPYGGVIARLVAAALDGERALLQGDGAQSRDFVYVANIVQANLLASWVPGIGGSVFNVGCGQDCALDDLCRAIEAATGRTLAVERVPARAGEVRHSCADITAARAVLRYEPAIELLVGLERTVAWARGARDLGGAAENGTEIAALR